MKQRLALLPGPLLDAIGRRTERLPIQQARGGRQIVGKRLDNLGRLGCREFSTDLGARQGRRRFLDEQKPQSIGHLLQAIDRTAGNWQHTSQVLARLLG